MPTDEEYQGKVSTTLISLLSSLKFIPMGLLNQKNKNDNKKSNNKNPKNTGSKFISKGSKPAGAVVNKKGLTGGSRGS
ncbi:MAG TPA: hypothetical protein VNS32_15510 [Flavisolibacter sp.]|nr:hypothetical protein [Flavisolibacter sp.]